MPKQLVTVLGLVVSLGVIALGVFLVALPLYFQAVGVDAQTATVANTNAIYQAQVDNLTAEAENLDQINADVAGLRSQIPATGQLDDVFEVVARAAEASGVSLTAITAGEQVAFTARTGATEGDAAAVAARSRPDTGGDRGRDRHHDRNDGCRSPRRPVVTAGRQQVDFVISAQAADMAQATAFLDALRAGPRLLNSITATTTQSGEGTFDVQISALTFVDTEG